MGVGWQPLLGPVDADLVQKLHHLCPRVRAAQALMQLDTLCQLLFDRVERVQRCHRLLKDEADVIAAHFAQDPFGGADHFPPVIADRPGQFGVVAQQADGGERRHGLARPAFTDQGHGFALLDVKADAAHGVDQLAVLTEVDRQIANLKHRRHLKVFLGSKASRTPSKMKTRSDSMRA